MNYLIGFVLALFVGAFARFTGFDRDRAFYPTVLIVVASCYVLFAVMGGSSRALVVEGVVATAFAAAAVKGFRGSEWLVVAGLAGHGVMDFFHAHIVDNPGVPEYWPGFCGAYDVAAAAVLAWIIKTAERGSRAARTD